MNMLDVSNLGYDRGRAVAARIEVPQEGKEYEVLGERVVIKDFFDARTVMLDHATRAELSGETDVVIGMSESALARRPGWTEHYRRAVANGICTEVEDRLSVAGF
ncbi:hypothetical protein [Paraburkholderia kirstenboschensis]|uniref:Uncharacterized protein n=1 Tax=Paraburkholderia kirstenboschensis TaxID=1245436 RepID=A0ABZ0EFH3_9BURK|nr:hypothetical protein [Paraburkholderia kirstenboschensis]WOD15956.1 hypothetical protein RW095_22265 [Paraburkholderia kirstenboschensis]